MNTCGTLATERTLKNPNNDPLRSCVACVIVVVGATTQILIGLAFREHIVTCQIIFIAKSTWMPYKMGKRYTQTTEASQ